MSKFVRILLIVAAVALAWQFAARLGQWDYHPSYTVSRTVVVSIQFAEAAGVWCARIFGAILPECWAQFKYWTGWIWENLELFLSNIVGRIKDVLIEVWRWVEWFVEKYIWVIIKELLYAAWDMVFPLIHLILVPIRFLVAYFTELFILATYYGGSTLIDYYWWIMLLSTPVCMLLVERLVFWIATHQQWRFYLTFRNRYMVTYECIRTLVIKLTEQLSDQKLVDHIAQDYRDTEAKRRTGAINAVVCAAAASTIATNIVSTAGATTMCKQANSRKKTHRSSQTVASMIGYR